MIDIIQSLHEQREYPDTKTIHLYLQKGVMLESLLWDKKTEDVEIKERFVLKDFSWSEEEKHEILTVEFEKVDLEENKKIGDSYYKM